MVPPDKSGPSVSESEKTEAPASVSSKNEKSKAATFSHQALIQRCPRSVGHPSHVIAGALHSVKKKKLTIAECTDLCEKWLKGKVK